MKAKLLLLPIMLLGFIVIPSNQLTLHAEGEETISESVSEEQEESTIEESSEEQSEGFIEQLEKMVDGETEEEKIEGLQATINALSEQVNKYKDMIENEAVKSLIQAILTFIACLGALIIKYKSIDASKITLDSGVALFKVAKEELTTATKQIADLVKATDDANMNIDKLTELFTKQTNAMSATILRLTQKIDELENTQGMDALENIKEEENEVK